MDTADRRLRLVDPPDLANLPRAQVLHWMWQVKFTAAKNVAHVADKMLHACGGTAYKPQLGIERYLRDGKAGWVMGPSNEILRQFVGKASLLGFPSLDYWNQAINERAIANEVKKMDAEQKRALAERLLGRSRPGGAGGRVKQRSGRGRIANKNQIGRSCLAGRRAVREWFSHRHRRQHGRRRACG